MSSFVEGRIEEVRKSKSGRSLGIKVDGNWYLSKQWTLENAVGKDIEFEPSPMHTDDGNTLYWLNDDYVLLNDDGSPAPPPAKKASPAKAEDHRQGYIEGKFTENVLLLKFVGQTLSGLQWQPTDETGMHMRAQIAYRIGKRILDGSILTAETAPRRDVRNKQPTDHKAISERRAAMESEPQKSETDFDDDIPF